MVFVMASYVFYGATFSTLIYYVNRFEIHLMGIWKFELKLGFKVNKVKTLRSCL